MHYLQINKPNNELTDLQTLINNKSQLLNDFNNLDAYLKLKVDEALVQSVTHSCYKTPTVIATTYSFKSLPPKLPQLNHTQQTLAKIRIFNLLNN